MAWPEGRRTLLGDCHGIRMSMIQHKTATWDFSTDTSHLAFDYIWSAWFYYLFFIKENPHPLFVFIQSNLGRPSPLNFMNFTFPFTSTLAIMDLSLIFREVVYYQCHILNGRRHFCKHLQSKHFKCSLCLFAPYFSSIP